MEIYNVNSCSEELIDLKSEDQLESLLKNIKDSSEVMIRWKEYSDEHDCDVKKSKILLTDNLMARIKDGRLALTSTKEIEEED